MKIACCLKTRTSPFSPDLAKFCHVFPQPKSSLKGDFYEVVMEFVEALFADNDKISLFKGLEALQLRGEYFY